MTKRKQPGPRAKRGEGKPQRPPSPDAKDAVEQFNDAAPTTRQLQAEYDKSVIGHFEKTGETPASLAGHHLQSSDVAQRFAVEWDAAIRFGDIELMKIVIKKYEVQPQTLDLQTLLDGARSELLRMAVEQKDQLHASQITTGADTAKAGQTERVDATSPVSRIVARGKFCNQVIDEIKRIKNLVVGTGRSIAEVQQDHPEMAAWNVRAQLSQEDQETFNHPHQWGSPVGYAKMILSKTHGVTTHTITSSVKAYRRDVKTKKG